MSDIRVRFAPSPTGPLHLGGVRTALYNFLFARRHGGKFILRIEDTDRNRFVPGAEQYIIESLKWCGLSFDEGIEEGGPYAPYRQSDRSVFYREQVQRLLENGHAYYAFDTPEELETARRQAQTGNNTVFQYNYLTRELMKNSLSLPADKVREFLEQGVPYVVRIRIPENETVVFHDLIRGEVSVHTENLDDKVLFKSDGLPTYHLANVVDDYLMKITHVIRGEEWLPSAPMHLLLYRFFGWEEVMPEFAHLPLILKPDGNGKLSKRDGDRLGFPVFPLQWKDSATGEISHGYREDGYLPEAFINMLALLGWNPGTEQEIFTLGELIHAFSIERTHKAGSKFDPEKAKWFNHQYIQKKTNRELARIFMDISEDTIQTPDPEKIEKVCGLIKERVVLLPDLLTNSRFFFLAPESYDEQVKGKIWRPETNAIIAEFVSEARLIDPWNKDTFHDLVQDFTSRKQVKTGQLMTPLRLLVVGSNQGPGIADIADVLGKDEFLARITTGLDKI